jgi:hypothetical protein
MFSWCGSLVNVLAVVPPDYDGDHVELLQARVTVNFSCF